jgi:cytochrome c-type biogenesis protein CcmH/NrfG
MRSQAPGKGSRNMSRKEITRQIRQFKKQLRADNRASDIRLVKLAVIMVILALIAAMMYGRIQFWRV